MVNSGGEVIGRTFFEDDEASLLADVRWTLAKEELDPDDAGFRERMEANLEATEGGAR